MIRPEPRSAVAIVLAVVLACPACGGASAASAPASAPSNVAAANAEQESDARQETQAAPNEWETADPPPASPETKRKSTRTMGWIFLAIGAEAAVVALGTSYLMLHAKSNRDDGCDARKVCSASGYDGNSQISSLAGWNAAAWIVGAAGLGVGTWLVLATSPDKKKERAAVTVAPNGAGMGLQLRSAF